MRIIANRRESPQSLGRWSIIRFMDRLEQELRRRLDARSPRRASEDHLRPAAVLVPLISEAAGYKLLLTVRASSLRRQPGDISFPGGAIDPADSSPLAAALRESEEEVGLNATDVDILGQMDEMPTITGFRITPFVGLVTGPYAFQHNHEVEELLLVPLATLRKPSVVWVEQREIRPGHRVSVYHYRYGEHDIWGITGRLVKELLELLPREITN
jgi:8-oxo-dGTP pyrophosphatase MutT (NUDIX family)